MVASTSRLAYSDCLDLLEQALSDSKGVRVPFTDYKAANHFRMRVHQARQIDRRENAATYPEDHRLHGRSVYDVMVASIKCESGRWYLYLTRRSIEDLTIESLSEIDYPELPAPPAPVAIAAPTPQLLIESHATIKRRA